MSSINSVMWPTLSHSYKPYGLTMTRCVVSPVVPQSAGAGGPAGVPEAGVSGKDKFRGQQTFCQV